MSTSVEEIQQRNQRVEADKAWETSWMRIACLAVLIYIVAAIFMWRIGVAQFWWNALIPPVGYVLSTLSLSPLKRWWIRKYLRR